MKVYLALGANRGNRAAHLAAALRALPGIGVHPIRVSGLRATSPAAAATGRRRYFNAVAEARTRLLPQTLLARLQRLEHRLGRHRGAPAARRLPRSLDLDLIFYGRSRIHSPALMVPHPRFRQRRFVLEGLAELTPRLHAPGQSVTMRRALRTAPRAPRSQPIAD